MNDLPPEMIYQIQGYLTPRDYLKSRLISQSFAPPIVESDFEKRMENYYGRRGHLPVLARKGDLLGVKYLTPRYLTEPSRGNIIGNKIHISLHIAALKDQPVVFRYLFEYARDNRVELTKFFLAGLLKTSYYNSSAVFEYLVYMVKRDYDEEEISSITDMLMMLREKGIAILI